MLDMWVLGLEEDHSLNTHSWVIDFEGKMRSPKKGVYIDTRIKSTTVGTPPFGVLEKEGMSAEAGTCRSLESEIVWASRKMKCF